MELPSEKVAELRRLIHSRVSQLGIRDEIRGCVDSLDRDGAGGRTLDEEALMSALEERGVVDHVMQSLNLSDGGGVPCEGGDAKFPLHIPNKDTPRREVGASPQKAPLSPNRRYLFLQALGGRAFVEHLQDSEDRSLSTFTLHVHFRGQRFRSRPVPCACEPDISEGFLLELTRGDRDGRMVSYADALSMAESVHVVLTRTNRAGEVDLVGTCHLQWRQVLSDSMGRSSLSVELSGVGSEAKIPAGVLELKLEVLPRAREVLHADIVSGQIAMEKQRAAEKERLFLVYAKQWWKEFLQIRASHSQRLVKIFAQDESGKSRPVCSYVHPLRTGRLLDGPRHAARFVSLISFERAASVGSGGCCSEVWSSLHVLLSQKKGECEDHAVLLCSLLLGFGLDAYVCIGTKAKGLAHAWVLTLGHDGSATFWESLTGQRFLHPEFDPNTRAGRPVPQPPHPYRTLGCLFNHKAFLANAQPSDSVPTCRFNLHNESLWKAMSPEAIKSVTQGALLPGGRFLPPFLPARVDPTLVAGQLEVELRALAAQHREDLGLRTVWDDDLSYLLSPALAAYELERCVGVSAGNEEFQEAVRNAVPEGHTFKGFPIQLVHRNARRAFSACLRSPVCSEILGCRGDHVRLAVRVRVFPYPEDISAVWIMFAVKYKSVV